MADPEPDDLEALKTIVEALKPFKQDDQDRILRWTREKFGLEPAPSKEQAPLALERMAGAPASNAPREQGARMTDIKSFVNSKNPQSDNQFAATVGYYYQFEAPEAQRKTSINSADVQDATRLAGRNRLGDPSKTLRNAVDQGYFDVVERGSYALSTVGENLVAMALPQAEGKVRVVKQKRKTKKTKRGK